MHVVSMVKLVIGILLLIGGVIWLLRTRGQRGFGQDRQAGVLMLVVGAIFLAVALGYLNLSALFGR